MEEDADVDERALEGEVGAESAESTASESSGSEGSSASDDDEETPTGGRHSRSRHRRRDHGDSKRKRALAAFHSDYAGLTRAPPPPAEKSPRVSRAPPSSRQRLFKKLFKKARF